MSLCHTCYEPLLRTDPAPQCRLCSWGVLPKERNKAPATEEQLYVVEYMSHHSSFTWREVFVSRYDAQDFFAKVRSYRPEYAVLFTGNTVLMEYPH